MSAASRPLRIAVTDPIMSAFSDDLRRTERPHEWVFADPGVPGSARAAIDGADVVICSRPVSYTHLTLPTKRIV